MDPENSPIYSNAVYTQGRLVSPIGNYPFPTWLKPGELPADEFRSINNGDYSELWYKPNKEKVVVVARERETMIEAITLFSYIFCSFLFLVVLVQLLSFLRGRASGNCSSSTSDPRCIAPSSLSVLSLSWSLAGLPFLSLLHEIKKAIVIS
jgi:hypothetical protein